MCKTVEAKPETYFLGTFCTKILKGLNVYIHYFMDSYICDKFYYIVGSGPVLFCNNQILLFHMRKINEGLAIGKFSRIEKIIIFGWHSIMIELSFYTLIISFNVCVSYVYILPKNYFYLFCLFFSS